MDTFSICIRTIQGLEQGEEKYGSNNNVFSNKKQMAMGNGTIQDNS
jgi:hypothetical protein